MSKVRVQMSHGSETWVFDSDAPIAELVQRVENCLKTHTFCILDGPMHPMPIATTGKISDRYHWSSLIVVITLKRAWQMESTEDSDTEDGYGVMSIKRPRMYTSSNGQRNKRDAPDQIAPSFKRLCLS